MFSWFFFSSKGEGGEAPRFVLPLSPIRASDGEPTKLICTLTGKPIPQITWYCGQRELRPSRDFQPAFEPSTGTASLTITEVFPDDEGTYRCRATNAHGTVECEAPLTVGDMIVVSHQELVRAPVIGQPLEPDIVQTGSRKVMTIRFDGYPTPEVKWYHNGREIQQNENRLVTTFKNESTLVIVRCHADSTGKYEARAMNEGGEARTSASIQLGDVQTTAQQPPKFRKALRPQIVPESEAIVMDVEVESLPECVFSWKQHGAAIRSTEAMQISTQNNRSTLFIPESFVENSGIYTVKAENPAGSVASTATLTVERQLLAEEFTPPEIVKELAQMKVMDGEEVHLTCQVSGTPMPRIKWYHNGQPVREHNGVMMSLSPQGEAVLRLAEAFPEDAGVYECKAVNRAGQITTSTTLHVERYEYIPDSESASITAGPSVGTWEDLTGPSGSEDDLLSDKPVAKKVVKTKTDKKFKFQPQPSKDEELVQDSGAAPRFAVALPQHVDVKDGHQARFEVKVESYPRSSVFWYLNGKEIQPSKDFGIDHLEDGTSILTLSEVFPDDAGELMCEAHNDKGVVTSITHLNVTEYKDTPTYRKPEWVTRMEIVRAQMLESQQPPQFTTEIVDARVQEGEEAKFECFYAGNPKPDICWYFNNKLINPNPNVKIRIKDNSTSCTILEVDQDLEGEYMCKATSSSGAHLTKARLHVHELTGEARDIWLAKKAKVIEEKKRKEKEKEDKKTKKEKGAKLTKEEYLKQAMQEKEAAKAEEAKKLAAIEEAKQAKIEAELQPKPEVKVNKAKIQKEAMIEESLNKFVENQAIGLKALLEMTERKSLNVTEVVTQDKANEFSQNQAPFKEFLQIETMLKSGITVDQIVTLGSIGNLPTLTAPETQKALVRLVEDQGFKAVVLQEIVREAAKLAPEEPLGMKAVLKAIETKSAAVEDIVVMATHPEEFNLEAPPVPEMATVSTLLNEGISCEEMLTIVKAGELPALNLPENQWALIQIMEKLGQTAIVSQVIVEEPALNLPAMINEIPQTVEERLDKFITNQSIGLRALIDIAVQESVNVSEMATLDRVQEFQPGQAPFQEFLNVDTMLKSGVSVDQIVTLGSTGNLPVLTAPESQKALVRIVEDHGSRAITREIIVKEAAKLVPEEVIGLKAVLKAVKTKKADIKDIVEMATRPEEFGLDAQPVPEMASVSTLLHEGISCEEMLTIVKAGELPALQLPETQWPLIQIMERLGQTAIVSQTIIEEPTLGLKIEIPEMASSVESTVEPLSTAVVEVLPDEPSAIATLEHSGDNLPEKNIAKKKKKTLRFAETSLTPQPFPTSPLIPQSPKDLVSQAQPLAEEGTVTTEKSSETVELKMKKVKQSIRMDAEVRPSSRSDVKPKDKLPVVIQSTKRDGSLEILPTEIVGMTVEPTKVNIETSDTSVSEVMQRPAPEEEVPLKSQDSLCLEPVRKTELEMTPETSKPLKKTRSLPKRELATFEVEKVTLKPVKKIVVEQKKDEHPDRAEMPGVKQNSPSREELPEEQVDLKKVDAAIELKKKRVVIKSSVPEQPETSPFQQEYHVESILKEAPVPVQPETVKISETKMTPENVVFVQSETVESFEPKPERAVQGAVTQQEPIALKIESTQAVESTINVRELEIKKKPKTKKTQINLTSEADTTELSEFKTELALPSDIQPQEPQHVKDVTTVEEIQIKKKPKPRKTEIGLASESVSSEKPEVVEPLELKSQVKLPSQPEEVMSATTESVQVVQDVAKEVERKKKPRTLKTKTSLAPESITAEQPDTTESLRLKTELTMAPRTEPEVATAVTIAEKIPQSKTEISLKPKTVLVQKPETVEEFKSEVTLQPEELATVKTESTQVVQEAAKDIVLKKKPKTQKTEVSLAPESVAIEQVETTEPLELKSELTFPSDIQPEPLSTTEMQQVSVIQDTSPKKDVKKKRTKLVIADEERPVASPRETESLQVELVKPSDIQQETQLASTAEEKIHQSGATLDTLTKPKSPKTIIKKVSIQETVQPIVVESKAISIETKSVKRAVQTETAPVIESQSVTSISLQPKEEDKDLEVSTVPEQPKQPLQVTEAKIEPVVEENQDVVVQTKMKIKKTRRVSDNDSKESSPVAVTRASMHIDEEVSQSPSVTRLEQPEEPREVSETAAETGVIQDAPILKKTKKRTVKTVEQSSSQKETVELPVELCELVEQPDEPFKQTETTRIELKRPKEPKSTETAAPERQQFVQPIIQEMSIESKSTKRDVPSEVSTITLEQPKYSTEKVNVDIPQGATVTQEFTIQAKSEKIVQPSETFNISLSSKVSETETAQTEDSTIIKKTKETSVKRKSKKVSREHREATPVAPLVPAGFSEVASPALEQVMLDERPTLTAEYAELRLPETQKATLVQQAVAFDSSGDFTAGKSPFSASAKPKLDIQEGLQCQEVQVIPFQTAIVPKKAESVSASIEMMSSFPLEVGEVQVFNKPEKYMPALFVATEKARPRLTTESALITTETRPPEREGSYTAARLPPTQQANVALSLRESASIAQARLHESESHLRFDRPQESATAAMEPVSSLVAIVNKQETQLSAEELIQRPESIKQKGKMSVIPHESLVRDEPQTTEREISGIVKLPTSATERAEPVMVTSRSLSVHTQQPYQSGDLQELTSAIPASKTAKKVQDINETISSHQVVIDETTGDVEETKTPAGQAAMAGCVALESAATTQKMPYESEGNWTETARLPSIPAPKSTMETFTVAQTGSTMIVDKESSLELPILPESNQASSRLESFLTTAATATVNTLQSAEPFAQAAVVSEKPKVVGSSGQSLPSIQQVYVEEAAAKFSPQMKPEAKQAVQVLDEENGQTSAQTGETWTQESAMDTLPESATTDQAHVSLQPHLAVVQLSVVPSSAGDVFKKEETPTLQSARADLVPLQGIASAQQIPSHEREGQILSPPTVPTLRASLSVQNPMESSVTQEIQTSFKEQVLPQFNRPELDTASCSVSGDSRSMLPVTVEVGSDECLASYVAVPVPTAESRLIHEVQQCVGVTANEAVEREVEFVSDTLPKQQTITQTAHLVTSGSVVTSEVRPEQMPNTFQQAISDVIPQASQACCILARPTIHPLTLTETATSESLAPMQTQRPVESKAALELPQQQSLLVSQHQLIEQEAIHSQQTAPQKQQVNVKLTTREAIVTDHQQQVQHGSDYHVPKPTTVSLEAKIVPSNQGKAAQVTETQTGSFAGQFQTADQIRETAQLSMSSMETATVSHVWDYRKEADWVPTSAQPAKKTAQAVASSELRSVQVEQTQTVEAGGQLDVTEALMADSTSSITPLLEMSSLYSAQIFQKEKPLEQFVRGQSQSARPVAPSERRTVQVSQVQTSIHESPLDIVRPVEQTAKSSLPQSEVAVKTEDVVMDYCVPQKQLAMETATPNVSFTEQRAVSVGHVIESGIQSSLSADSRPEEKTAIRSIPEHVQMGVASVQVAYKEGLLDDFVTAQSQRAKSMTDEQRTVVVSEVQPQVSEVPLENQTMSGKFAQSSQVIQEAPVTQEVTVMDFTTQKSMDNLVEERPTVNITEQRAVSVQQVVEGSTATELVPDVKKKSKKATRAQIERTEISVGDVQLAFKEAPLEEFSAGQPQSARWVKEEQRTVQISQVQTEMKEEPLEIVKPTSKTAMASVPEKQTVVISQDVLMDFTLPQTAKVVDSVTPVVNVAEHRAVSVAQVVEASSESQLVPEFKPKSKKASRHLPEKTETTVFQVETVDKEAPIEAFVAVPSQLANVSADEQRTVHVTQVVSEMKEVPLESQMPLGRKAKMDVQEAIARTTQEQLPLDVTILHKSRPTETETAFVVHPEKKALSVSTVVESSTESEMAPSVQPERKTAKASVSQSEAIFSSQNLLMDTIERQTEEKAELEKPVVRMTEQLAVNVGQVVESSTEVELVPQVKKKTKKATRVLPEKNVTSVQDVDVSFKEAPLDEFVQGPVQSATVSAPEEKRTIQVAEIQTSVSAAPLAVTRRPSAETVRARLPENQAAVQQETVAMDFTVPKAVATVIEELPNVSVIEHKAVSIDQVVEGSTGAELVPEIKKKTKKATRVLPQKTETSVSDVQVAFKEVPMQDFTVGQSQTAVAVMDESKTLEISQTQSSIREEVLEIEKPKRGTAKSRLPEAETVVVSENVVMDFAAPQTVAETEKPTVTVQEQKAVSVSHVVEASSESELVAEVKPKSRKASRSLPQRSEEIGVAQVELTETLSDLDRLPAAVQASSRDIPLVKETADVTEQVVNIAPEEDVSFSDDSFQSLASSSSTLIEDTMMTAASSLEDLVEEVQLPVVIQEEIEDVEASFQLPSPKDEDTISQEFSIGLKPKSEPVVESEDVQATVKLAEDVVDVSASKKIIKKKKKKVVKEDVEESVTIQATKSEEQLVESAAVFKLKQQVMHDTPWQDVEEEYVFKKETGADEEESANLTIKKSVKSKPYQVEEVEDVVNLASIRKVEPVAVEDVEKAATLKLKPVKVVVEQEDVEEQFKIGLKPVKPKERTDDVEHEMTIKPKGQPRQVVDAEDVVLKMVQKQEVPYRVEEIEDELQVKPILKKKKKVVDDTVESGATFKLKETVAVDDAEDVEQQFQIGLKPKRKSKVQIQTVEDEAAFSLKRPAKSVVVIQEASEAASLVIQQPADNDSVSTAERTSQSISQQFTDSGVVSITDVIIQPKKTKKPYRVEDVEDAFAVQARKVKDSAEGDDVEGGAIFKLKSQGETSEDVQEEFSLGLKARRPVKPSISVEADESLRFKIPARPKVSAPTLVEDGNTLTVTRAATSVLADTEEETTCPLEPQEGDEFFSLCSYVADTEEAMNLVEGERVYVLEWHNSDWWFVRKHLTEETGWVPAQYLKDDTSYTHYVKKKLDEKINKLPVFDLPSTDESKVQAPRFLTKLQPIRAPDGTSVTFECQVEGSPRPVITWFRQTAVIKPSQDFQMVYDEEGNLASLTIVEVFPEDAGTFTCVAKNSAGFASSSTELVVEAPLSDHGSDTTITSRRSLSRESSLMDILEGIPPTFSQRPKTKTVDEGTDVELECRLVAVPEPDVAWFHNGKRIKPSDRIALLGQSDVHMYCSIIQIKDVQMTDEGTYDIIARNREGEAVSHVVLNVKVKGAKKMPPQVDQPLKNAVVQIGSSVTLTAKVTGIPSPVVKWYRNGVEIQTNVTTNERGVSTLIIPAAQPEDDGDYMLNAENEHGQVQTSATLTVQPPSKLHFVEKFSHVSVLEGDPFVLKATLSAPAEVSWYRNGKRLKPTKSLKITSDGLVHTLQVSSASVDKEIGEYKCVASATGGTKISHAAHVTVECNIFVQPLEDVEVDAGSDVVLLCRTKEPAEVFWYRDDILLAPLLPSGQEGPVQESRDREHKLVMRRVGRKETGRYSCTFHNQTTACVFTVRAEPAHEFVTKIKDLEIKERQPAVFTADVSDDAAQVTWHKDGEPLDQANTERYEFVAEARKRSFTIRSVSLLDEGEYTCSLADQECTAELVVIELPPEITLRLQDVTVRRGEEASFEIELTKGDAKIQWFRNNEEIQLSEHIQLAIDGKRQRLVIYDSGPEDACEYSCVIGDQKSAARLQVLAPKVNFVAKLPEIVAAPMGQDVTFTVQLTGEDAEVTWMKNGEVVVDSDRIKLTRDGCARSLTITKAAIEDSAEYTCILEAMKTVTVLTVEVPKVPPSIPIDQVHAEVWVRRGEDAVIEVPFNGFPTPKAEWTFKGKAIRKTKKSVYSISETSAQLTLKLVDENEAGVYTCKLSNECGDVSVSVTIKLIEKPSSPSAPECLETADDSITIMWKPPGFNGGSVITNYIIEYQEKQTKKWLTANKDVTVIETTYMVTKLTHNTEYRFRVTAVNSAGPGTPSGESLLFKAAKAAIPEAPVIREPLKDVTAGLKETATLSCIIVGVPQPTLTWYKDDDEFVPKSSSYESGLARLILNNTTEESAGQYTCRASNDSGSVECSCTLTIQEAPKIVPEKKTKVYRLQVEKQWSITAKVTGLPRPDITWTKNGASFEGNTHYIADVEAQSSTACSTTLTIITTERTDTAKYTLTATNVAGTVTHDVTLKISDKPSKPQGPLVAKEVDKTSATMEWKPPLDDGGIELKGYVVEYSEIFTEQWKQVEEICPHPICHVQNLTEGLEYVFRVSAVNDVGTSEPLDTGAPVLIKSQFDTPSAPRGPLDISGMTDTSLVLKWLPPTSDGGSPLTEYLIERREVSKKAWQKVGAVDGKTTYIEACSLKKGTSYNFRITAQNQLGYGPAYSPEDVIVAGKRITPPSPPSNLQVADITSRSVTLQWAPPASTGGAELTGYIIEKMLQGTDKWEKVVTLDPSVTVHCIQNLKERSEFFFRVFTENPMGLSAPAESEKVSLKTHATVPSPPTSPLEVRPVGPNSIIVEWGIPESDGGAAIDGYIVAVRDSRKTMWMEVGQVGADTTRLIVKDMQEGHKYYVRVFARNEVGLSDPLETEEPVKVVRPPDYLEPGIAGPAHKDPTASLSLSTETLSSWMRDANMDADIRIYSRSSLLRRDEYFFRVWYYSRQLFK